MADSRINPETYYLDMSPSNTKSPAPESHSLPSPKSNNVQKSLYSLFRKTAAGSRYIRDKYLRQTPDLRNLADFVIACQNGLAIVPQTTRDTGLLHNRRMSLWPYCDMGDERVWWGRELISLRQDPPRQGRLNRAHQMSGFAGYLANGASL